MKTISRPLAGAFAAGVLTASAVAMTLTTPWTVGAAPGDDDTTFVPITACRLADTRPAPNRVGDAGSFGPASSQTFQATGSNGECTGIPSTATALSMNVTALGASQLSFLTFWGSGDRPLAASLNPAPGQPPVPNAVITDLSPTGSFEVFNASGSVDIVIDVNGYYTAGSLKDLAAAATAAASEIDALTSRVSALETGSGGADPQVAANSAKIAAIESDVTAIESDVTAIESDVTAIESDVTAIESDVTAIDDREPFSAMAVSSGALIFGTDHTIVQTLTMTAPSAGSITVSSTVNVADSLAASLVSCSITTGTTLDTAFEQREADGIDDGASGQLAGTRVFAVSAGQQLTARLVCQRSNASNFAAASDPVLSGIFTPAP